MHQISKFSFYLFITAYFISDLNINRVVDCKLYCNKASEYYKPCECFPISSQVYCEGEAVSDDTIATINSNLNDDSDKLVGTLVINNTRITKINNLFTAIDFDRLFIENNPNLTVISANNFKRVTISVSISNNPNLSDVRVFDLVKKLIPNFTIDLGNNAFTVIPSNAFGNNSLVQHIYLDYNHITKISSEAFKGLPNLTQLSIDHNLINTIDYQSLNFDPNSNVTVLLHNNSITSDIFKNLNSENIAHLKHLSLHLENNKIADLPETFVKKIISLNNTIELFFNGNTFVCNCSLSWLTEYNTAPNNVHNVYCFVDDMKQSIFQIEKQDICNSLK